MIWKLTRWIGTAYFLFLSYKETGPYTVFILTMTAIAVEIAAWKLDAIFKITEDLAND